MSEERRDFVVTVLFLVLQAVASALVRLATAYLEEKARKPAQSPPPGDL